MEHHVRLALQSGEEAVRGVPPRVERRAVQVPRSSAAAARFRRAEGRSALVDGVPLREARFATVRDEHFRTCPLQRLKLPEPVQCMRRVLGSSKACHDHTDWLCGHGLVDKRLIRRLDRIPQHGHRRVASRNMALLGVAVCATWIATAPAHCIQARELKRVSDVHTTAVGRRAPDASLTGIDSGRWALPDAGRA